MTKKLSVSLCVFEEISIIFMEGFSDVEDIWLMSLCKHNILQTHHLVGGVLG
jgi:hypothetical protein